MAESVARLKASKVDLSGFVWKQSDMVPFLKAALNAPPDAIIRGVLGLDANGNPDLWFVVPSGTKDGGDDEFNSSHPCPGNLGCPPE